MTERQGLDFFFPLFFVALAGGGNPRDKCSAAAFSKLLVPNDEEHTKKTAPVGINLISGLESNVGSVEQEFCGVKDQRCLIHSTCGKFKCPGSK